MDKITEKDLIQSLKQLKKVKPNQNWVIFCRENLIAKFPVQEKEPEKNLESFDFVSIFRHFKFPRLALRPVAVLSIIFLLIFGTGLTALSKAKDSLPGDHLYPVKIALEQARLLTTTSDEGRAKVQSEMIAVRLDELNKVIELNGSIEDKAPRIEEAVNNLQKHLLTINDELPKLDDKTEAKKAVEMAKIIDANAANVQHALSQAKLSLSPKTDGKLNKKIAETADMADKASNDALELMVMKQNEAGTMSSEEISAKLGEKIQNTEKQMKSLAETVANSPIGNKLPINASIILDESDKAIEQAKASLESNDMVGALQTIQAASELVKSAQKLVDVANPESPQGSEAVDNSNATSTTDKVPAATSTGSTLK